MSDISDSEFKIDFLVEAKDLLINTEQCFLNLEKAKDDPDIIEQIFRLAHNIKGSAKAVGFEELGNFTHILESFLLKIKNKEIGITGKVVSLLLQSNDLLLSSVDKLKENLAYKIEDETIRSQLEIYLNGNTESAEGPTPLPEVEAEMVDRGNRSAKVSSSSDDTIRVSLSKIDQVLNNIGEIVILQTVMMQQRQHAATPLMQKTIVEMSKIIKEVQELSMSLRMLPLKSTFQKMQRIVRDVSANLQKKVDITLQGEDTELDKVVLEQLMDPLVHLIRNAVDHGIENTEERITAGKNPAGLIVLSAFQKNNHIVIEIKDDGKGLDASKLIARAKQKNILSAEQELTKDQAYQLIFAPGFSTKDIVTDVSGRGVGMDVVKTNISRLQGEIQIETELGKGTTFRIILPLTLAIADGMVVRVASERYVIPVSQVTEFFQATEKDLVNVVNKGDVLNLRGQVLPVYELSKLLRRNNSKQMQRSGTLIIAKDVKESAFAILVDEILGQQQVVIKNLGEEISGYPGLVGASILGDGKASFILDIFELVTKMSVHKKVREAV